MSMYFRRVHDMSPLCTGESSARPCVVVSKRSLTPETKNSLSQCTMQIGWPRLDTSAHLRMSRACADMSSGAPDAVHVADVSPMCIHRPRDKVAQAQTAGPHDKPVYTRRCVPAPRNILTPTRRATIARRTEGNDNAVSNDRQLTYCQNSTT